MAIDVEALYRRYAPMVLRRCRLLLKDEQAAHDAMQDVFVQVIRRQGSLDDRAPSSLLFRMATNICLNKLRSAKRKPEDRDEALLGRIVSATDDQGRSEARSILNRLWRDEPDSTATIAVLHLLDGMTLDEVAEEVGMSVSGVRKRLRKLKGRLAEVAEV